MLALPSISRRKRNEIIEKLSPISVHVRSLPSVSELAEGKVKIDDLLEVDIEDLLGREQVAPNKKLLKIKIKNLTKPNFYISIVFLISNRQILFIFLN